MADWEDKLSPRMRERLANIGDLSPEDRERMRTIEQRDSLLAQFHSGDIDSEGLWRQLREHKENGREYLLTEVQLKLIDSLGLETPQEEFQKREECIIAIETLKDVQNTSTFEMSLNAIVGLQEAYRDEMQQAYDQVKAEVEKNPQLRMQQVRQGPTSMLTQLTVDEAVKSIPQWRSFVANHEARYSQEFDKLITALKDTLRR